MAFLNDRTRSNARNYSFPLTLAFTNLLSTFILSIPFLTLWESRKAHLTAEHYRKFIIPISIGNMFAVGSAFFSLSYISVSYSHTVKAMMPFFVVVLSRIFLNENFPIKVHLSLLVIVAGVVIASATEFTFSFVGLISALFSTFILSIMGILVKKLMKETNVHPIRILAMTCLFAAILLLPFSIIIDGRAIYNIIDQKSELKMDLKLFGFLILMNLLSFGQSACAILLLHALSTLSYAVCSVSKRVVVIISSIVFLQNNVSVANYFGMFLTIVGVFCYQRSKRTKRAKSDELPTSSSVSSTLEVQNFPEIMSKQNENHKIAKSDSSLWLHNKSIEDRNRKFKRIFNLKKISVSPIRKRVKKWANRLNERRRHKHMKV